MAARWRACGTAPCSPTPARPCWPGDMDTSISLPGRSHPVAIPDPPWAAGYPPPASRRVFAAAHVAAFPDGSIDWAATLGFREYLWAHGFAVAEAMDTAQRGM